MHLNVDRLNAYHEATIRGGGKKRLRRLHIYSEACCRKGWAGVVTPPPSPLHFSGLSVRISFEDIVTVVLLHDAHIKNYTLFKIWVHL